MMPLIEEDRLYASRGGPTISRGGWRKIIPEKPTTITVPAGYDSGDRALCTIVPMGLVI
jgi:hypothetical protein